MSVVDALRSQVQSFRNTARKYGEKADRLEERISEIEEMLADVSDGGEGQEEPTQARRPGRPSRKESGGTMSVTKRRGRPAGSKNAAHREGSLKAIILNILKKKPSGLTLAEVVEECLKQGYKSNSDKFENIVYQNLYTLLRNEKAVEKDSETKKYRVKEVA